MKGKFLVPKIALLLILLGGLAVKFGIADKDLKAGKDQVQFQDHQKSENVSPAADVPVAYSQGDAPAPEQVPTIQAPTDGAGQAPATEEPETPGENADVGWLAFIKGNLLALVTGLLTFLELIVRLTKTEKDNSILNFLKSILDFLIPNRAVGGGKHS